MTDAMAEAQRLTGRFLTVVNAALLAGVPPKTLPRLQHPALGVEWVWLLSPRPTVHGARLSLWTWWRGVGRRGPGSKPRPTVCETAGCGRPPAADRRHCGW